MTNRAAAQLPPLLSDNRIVNPSMEIDQANEFASVAIGTGSNKFIADQWRVQFTGASTGNTAQVVAQAPSGFCNSLLVTVGTASGTVNSSDSLTISQNIEGTTIKDLSLGSATAGNVSLSFWVRSSIAGTFGWYFANSAANRSRVDTFTINAAQIGLWVSVSSSAIPLDTAGTWLTTSGIGLTFGIALMAGVNLQGATQAWSATLDYAPSTQVNFPGTSGATFQMTGVKISVEPVSSPLVRRHFVTEMVICRRFFRKTFPAGTAPAQNAGLPGALSGVNPIALGRPSMYVPFEPVMRAAPSVTTYNPSAANANFRDVTAGSDVPVSVDPAGCISNTGVMIAAGATIVSLGDAIAIHATFDARL